VSRPGRSRAPDRNRDRDRDRASRRDRAPGALRLFLAFDLPEDRRREIARRGSELARSLPAARWVRAENLHLTLSFLGDTDPERVGPLAAAVEPVFAASPPLVTEVAGAGTFPPRRPARVAWVGLGSGEALLDLQRRVAAAAAAAVGAEPDTRPFHAHVTLARPRKPWDRGAREAFAAAFETPVGDPFEVQEGVLYKSELGPGGSRYTSLETFPLRGTAA
jgi:2'-5' RNA ligase